MMKAYALISLMAISLSACGPSTSGGGGAPEVDQFKPDYRGIDTHLLDGDLVAFQVKMTGARATTDVERYAECAAAQYTLIRGFGFARHVQTNVIENNGLWQGDAVYTISSSLPDGVKKLDAEVVVADCAENGIPMV